MCEILEILFVKVVVNMGIKKLFEKSLFFDKNVIALLKIYQEGVQKSNKKSCTHGLWSYFLPYSNHLIEETKKWNNFITSLNLPKRSAILEITTYNVEAILVYGNPARDGRTISILKFKVEGKLNGAKYEDKSIKKLKTEIPKHVKNLNYIKKNMEWYIKTRNKDENSKPQCEFFNSIVPLITNTVAFLEELNKLI